MPTRSLTSYVCAAVAALILSPIDAGAIPRADSGLARMDRMVTVDALDAGRIVKIARRGGGRAGRAYVGPPAGAYRSFGPGIRRPGSSSGWRFYTGRRYAPRFRGYGFYTPIVPYFYRDYLPYDYAYDYALPAGPCEYWHRRCVANWGYGNSNYYGCMRFHRCLP